MGRTVETLNYESNLNSVSKMSRHGNRAARKFKLKLGGNVVEVKDGQEYPVNHDALS